MKSDLLTFGYVVCRDSVPIRTNCVLHRDIAYFHHERPTQAAIISPRGHGKTSWASTISTVYDIAYDSEEVIVLVKKTFKQAVNDLRNIINIVKYNAKFHQFFGKRIFLIDRQEKVTILNPHTGHKTYIEVKGAEQSIRGILIDGKRITKAILDDFEDEYNTLTEESREKVRAWMAAQVMPCMHTEKGYLLAIGTIVHYDSWLYNLYQRHEQAKEEGKEFSWKLTFHQMIENGEAIMPEKFTKQKIKHLKESYEELGQVHKYWQEYFNIPFDPEDAVFRKDHFKYFDNRVLYDVDKGHYLDAEDRKALSIVIGIDPSTGTSADYTGIVVLCMDNDHYRYVELAEREKMQPDEIVEKIFKLHHRYNGPLFIIEEVAMQVIMTYWLRSEMRKRNIFINIRGEKVPTRMTKEEKLSQALQPMYASGSVYHRTHQSEYEGELLTFPKGKNDDMLDAMWLASRYIRKPSRTDEFVRKVVNKAKSVYYDWMTGAKLEEVA